jgi:hypothetical protein
MSDSGINRRRFLESSGGTVAGSVAVSLATSMPSGAWAKPLGAIEQQTADVLLRVCRLLYPHDDLDDNYYAACVESLDVKAAADAALVTQLNEGVANLNGAPEKFLDLQEVEQIKALTALEATSFFQTVRGHMVVALYTDRKVWAELGYEGPSFKLGGYLDRGFNDIDWLPET